MMKNKAPIEKMSIPKKIHYIWLGPNPLPELTKKCIDSWRKCCSDYEIILWNESNLDIQKCKFAREAYVENKYGFVSDYFRIKIVYEHGGIYLDTDVELLKSLDSLLDGDGFFGFEDEKVVNTGLGFGSVANHPLLAALMRSYENSSFLNQDGTFNLMPCPSRDTPVFVKFGLKQNNLYQVIKGVHFLPKDYLCPVDYTTGKLDVTEHTYSIHHFMGSWLTNAQKNDHYIMQQLCRLFGRVIGGFLGRLLLLVKNNDLKTIIKKINRFYSV